jgi:hypothetical protein
MRSYFIEELYPEQLAMLRRALDARGLSGGLEGIYYLPLPEELLTDVQRAHAGECGPHILALEAVELVDEGALKLELLVRARGKLRCECVAYATPEQRAWAIAWLDDFIRQLDISV